MHFGERSPPSLLGTTRNNGGLHLTFGSLVSLDTVPVQFFRKLSNMKERQCSTMGTLDAQTGKELLGKGRLGCGSVSSGENEDTGVGSERMAIPKNLNSTCSARDA